MEIFIIVLGITLDRISKIWALKILKENADVVVIKNYFSFSYLENRGAAFGIFQNKGIYLSVITLFIVCAVIFYLVKFRPQSKLLRISLALIIGGAIGNLYDRIVYKYVVDFVLWHFKDVYYYPTFNVADMLVVVGTILLVICVVLEDKNENGMCGKDGK